MVKVEVIEKFTLQDFDELVNVERKHGGAKGSLFIGDRFECSEDMAKYLMGENDLKKKVVKVIEVKPKKEPTKENTEELKTNKKKKSSKK